MAEAIAQREMTRDRATGHPIAATLAAVSARNDHLSFEPGEPDGPGWVSAAAMLDDDGATLDARIDAMAAAFGSERRDVAAQVIALKFPWYVSALAVGVYEEARRVPGLDPAGVRYGFHGELTPKAVALAPGPFACMPGDPEAGHPDAEVVPDDDALRARLLAELEAHFAPFVSVIRPRARVSAATIWRALADNVAGTIGIAFDGTGDRDGYAAEIRRLLREGDAAIALRQEPDVVALPSPGGTELLALRQTCCCAYKFEGRDYCLNCPLKPREARVADLAAWAAGHAH